MEHKIEVDDRFEGILVETFRDGKVSRPRVRPIGMFLRPYMVEFPRNLRKDNPIGTQFICDLLVAQKHNIDGSKKGPPYLRADRSSIVIVPGQNFCVQVWAVKRPGTVSGRTFDYVTVVRKQVQIENEISSLREKLLELEKIEKNPRNQSLQVNRREMVQAYSLMRSNGICEACEEQAPFLKRNGKPYLECHHLISVASGGSNHPENIAAICPNCHARITHGQDGNDYNSLLKVKIYAKEQSER